MECISREGWAECNEAQQIPRNVLKNVGLRTSAQPTQNLKPIQVVRQSLIRAYTKPSIAELVGVA